MKIVQSFWSSGKNILEHNFGWLTPQHHLMAWALSCLKIREHYPEVVLHTDSNAARLFGEILKLPYTEIKVCFDNLEDIPDKFWAFPKLVTYGMQDVPFIHVDGDVFIWEKFDERLTASELIVQNRELGTAYYKDLCTTEFRHLKHLPWCLKGMKDFSSVPSVNAGILGGNNLQFLKQYSKLATEFVSNNTENEENLTVNSNVIFEQILFSALSNYQKVNVSCYLKDCYDDNGYQTKEFADFYLGKDKLKYLHLIGLKKKEAKVCDALARTLLSEYPVVFFNIVKLFDKINIFSGEISFVSEKYHSGKENSASAQTMRPDFDAAILTEMHGVKETFNKFVLDGDEKLEADISAYLQHLNSLRRKWDNLSAEKLYSLELITEQEIRFCNDALNAIKFTLQASGELSIDENSFMYSKKIYNILQMDLSNIDFGSPFGIVMSPSLFNKGIVKNAIDELDYNILSLLSDQMDIDELTEQIAPCFPGDDFTINQISELIFSRLKYLLNAKLIRII